MDVTKLRWVEIDGSIYTEEAFLKRSDATNKNLADKQRISIAFNVGQTAARHIVHCHNDQLQRGTNS
jgi:hypothetical protein